MVMFVFKGGSEIASFAGMIKYNKCVFGLEM